jgi:tetratricopeptide (TPR) repeat protein
MLMPSKPLNLVLIALTITLVCSQAASATKMNAKPLPRTNKPSGASNWDRGEKDFENDAQYHNPALSRFKRRPDYRDLEAQKKEEDAKKAADAIEAKKAAEAAQTQAEKKRADAYQKYKQDAIEFNNQGVALGSQGKWTDACAMHEKAVQYDPSNKQYKLNLSAARSAFADYKMKVGDSAGAAALYRKALFAEYSNAHAVKGLSSALEKTGVDPVDADARMALGDQLINSNDLEGAFVEYKQALEIDSSSAKCLVKFGDLQYRWGQVGQALQCYQQAAIKDPTYGPAQRQLGIIKLLQKDETGAAALLRKAVILDDSDVLAGTQLVDIWRRQVAKNPLNPDFHLGFAGALQLTGDYAGAEAEYKKLEMLNANHPGLADGRASLQKSYQHGRAEKHRKAAETLFSQGLRKEALAEVSQAVMIEPRNSRYQFLLGECLESIGDYKGAHQAYLTCVLIDPEKNKEAAARMKEMQSSSPTPAQPTAGGMHNPQFNPMQQRMAPPQGMPPQGMAQQGMPPQGMAPQGMPQGMPQQGMNPGMPPQGMPQQGMPMNMQTPNGFPGQGQPMMSSMPTGMAPTGMAPTGMAPTGMAPTGMAPQGFVPNMQPVMAQNNFAAMPPQNFQMNKGVFEGAPGSAVAPTAASFRPQGFAPNQVAAQPFPTQQNAQPMGAQDGTRNSPTGQVDSTIYGGGSANDNVKVPTGTGTATTQEDPKLVEVTQAESRKDHMAAVALLRDVVATDLENASNHHRLAVNLMAAGRISEAVTEFRIASALKPGIKTYADDLARALATHKRSVMSNNDGTTTNTEDAKGGGN